MSSRYLLQIVDREDGTVVQFEPGLRAESDIITDCVNRVREKGVGLGRTSAHVEQDVCDAMGEAFHDLKSRIRPT